MYSLKFLSTNEFKTHGLLVECLMFFFMFCLVCSLGYLRHKEDLYKVSIFSMQSLKLHIYNTILIDRQK